MPAGAGDKPTPCRIASQAFIALRLEIARPLSHGSRSTTTVKSKVTDAHKLAVAVANTIRPHAQCNNYMKHLQKWIRLHLSHGYVARVSLICM